MTLFIRAQFISFEELECSEKKMFYRFFTTSFPSLPVFSYFSSLYPFSAPETSFLGLNIKISEYCFGPDAS
jgi:hypothetical protein